jgi:hypothetical protein
MRLDGLKPDQVVAWTKAKIREYFGDEVENESSVFAQRGWYYIRLYTKNLGAEQSGALRRKQIPAYLKSLR